MGSASATSAKSGSQVPAMPCQTLRYRSASMEDAARLSEFGIRSFITTYGDRLGYLWANRWARDGLEIDQLRPKLTHAQHWWLVVEHDEELVGYAELRHTLPPSCISSDRPIELGRLYIEPRLFGRGIAERMMQLCLEQAIERQADVLWLRVWAENHRAIAFYRRWGLREVGGDQFKLDHGYGDSLYMQRELLPGPRYPLDRESGVDHE